MRKKNLRSILVVAALACTMTACKSTSKSETPKPEPVQAESDYYQDERTLAYADYIATNGVNVHKGEEVIIYAPIYSSEFVNLVVDACYKHGAGAVNTVYYNEDIMNTEIKYASQLSYDELIQGNVADYYLAMAGSDIAYLSIESPHFYDEKLDDANVATYQEGITKFYQKLTSITQTGAPNQTKWCVAACPNANWAKKVYPELSTDEAVSTLWEDILSFAYLKNSADLTEVDAKNEEIKNRAQKLDDMNIQSLHFVGGETDIVVNLHKGYRFQGPEANTLDYTTLPNIPCAETFTIPQKTGVTGHVATTRPLALGNGVVIDKIQMDFKDGYLTDYTCSSDKDTFEQIISSDDARYMGEISLVPADTPIFETDKVFYTTLLDENAACHFALGSAYAEYNLEKGTEIDDEVNLSDTHVDFVFGTKDMDVTATLEDGSTTELFKKGVWVLDAK